MTKPRARAKPPRKRTSSEPCQQSELGKKLGWPRGARVWCSDRLAEHRSSLPRAGLHPALRALFAATRPGQREAWCLDDLRALPGIADLIKTARRGRGDLIRRLLERLPRRHAPPDIERIANLVIETKVARVTALAAARAGVPGFTDDRLQLAQNELRKVTNRMAQQARRGKDDELVTPTVRVFARQILDVAREDFTLAWSGADVGTTRKRVAEEEAFLPQLREDLRAAFGCSPLTIAHVFDAAGFDRLDDDAPTERPRLVEKIRKQIARKARITK